MTMTDGRAEKTAEQTALEGWTLVVCSQQGPAQLGYLGRVVARHDDGSIEMVDACAFTAVFNAQPGGRLSRTFNGQPILFTYSLTTVRARPIAEHALDELASEDAKSIMGIRAEADMLRQALMPGTPLIHSPQQPRVNLVGLNGQKTR